MKKKAEKPKVPVVRPQSDPTECPTGFVWSDKEKKCVANPG